MGQAVDLDDDDARLVGLGASFAADEQVLDEEAVERLAVIDAEDRGQAVDRGVDERPDQGRHEAGDLHARGQHVRDEERDDLQDRTTIPVRISDHGATNARTTGRMTALRGPSG